MAGQVKKYDKDLNIRSFPEKKQEKDVLFCLNVVSVLIAVIATTINWKIR